MSIIAVTLAAAAGGSASVLLRREILRATLRARVDDAAVVAATPPCPVCGQQPAAVLPNPLGRCRSCGEQLGPRPWSLELPAMVLIALAVARFGPGILGFELAGLAVVGLALAAVDRACLRLPDRLIVLALAIEAVAVGAMAVDGHPAIALRMLAGGIALAACYLVLAIIQPRGFGLGDVKLAGVLGVALGAFGWTVVLMGGSVPFLLSGAYSIVMLALRRISLRDSIPFGPFMLAGAALTVLL